MNEKDLMTQVEETRELLAASNARGEDKDLLIFEMEEKVSKLQSQVETHGKKYYKASVRNTGHIFGDCFRPAQMDSPESC